MSGVVLTVPRVKPPHPWRRLRALRDWTLAWHADGAMGSTCHETKTISLRLGLTWEQRRCTVLHECLHAEHGPVLDALSARHEHAVRVETARLMLPSVRAIGEALAWSQLRVREAAEELHVDTGVLWDRLDHLHPSERAYLTDRLREH